MTDKRKFKRFAIQVPARIEVLLQDGYTAKLESEILNLSAGGAFIKLNHPLPKNSHVNIDIVLFFDELKTAIDPSGSLILATTGHVVRSKAN